MPPDLDVPPGLGLERLSEQQKAKNPRPSAGSRKAKKRLARLERGARAGGQAAAPVAPDARPGAEDGQAAEAGPAGSRGGRAAERLTAAATSQPSSAARAQPGSSDDGPHADGRREQQPLRAEGPSNGDGRRQSLDRSQPANGQQGERPRRFAPHLAGPELQRGLKLGRLLRCDFRVNAGDRKQGFAGLAGLPADIQIQGLEAQNRAFPGDQVAVEILPQGHWLTQRVAALRTAKKALQGDPGNPNYAALEGLMQKLQAEPINSTVDAALQRTKSPEEAKRILTEKLQERPDLRAVGRVVAVLQPSFRRQHVVGVLTEQRGGWATLEPVDPRLPRGRVQVAKLPAGVRGALLQEPAAEGEWQLVSAIVQDWPQNCQQPLMTVRTSLGQSGEIEVETQAILEAEGVDSEEFTADVLACLPATPWSISEAELAARRDLRAVRTFTIDPPTARDLDDALSVEPLSGGRWRVGVHIADVSHFIPPGSALDAKAATRATTVYLVQRAVPMLPPLLCEQLCSLNPGVDRLAFSVMWVLDEAGAVHEQWTGRTVIRSCAKLAYRHAQDALDRACVVGEGEEAPVPLEAPHTWQQARSPWLALAWGRSAAAVSEAGLGGAVA